MAVKAIISPSLAAFLQPLRNTVLAVIVNSLVPWQPIRLSDRAAPRSSARCVWRTDRCTGPLCEVPIMSSLIGQSVIT
ncbi:unnamed protein product, partial [Staurois parvus]